MNEESSGTNVPMLQAEIARLNKMVQALMNRAERNANIHGSDFNLFQTTITLEDQVRRRTKELEAARLENEKINRTLRERENNYRLLVENSPVSIHEIGLDGKIISMSRAGLLMHGVEEESQIQGTLYLDGVSESNRERINELLTKAYTGQTYHFEYIASGSPRRIFKSCFVPIKNKNGNVEKLMGITEDITERKKMEQELKRKDKMMIAQAKQAAMGDMIAMIAHQWRQPLATIGMDVNTLLVSIALEEEISTDYLLKHANSLNQQIAQLDETIANFSNYFKSNQSKELISVENILKSTLGIIGKSLENNNIKLTFNNTTAGSLLISKSSLIQVLLNIFGNSQDALLANKVEQAEITITANETKEAIILSICDNAGGIPESIMDKIGQPYFTTKKELNGAGLGLYISRTIIEKHLHGTLTWHNADKGVCFVIALKLNHEK